MAIYVRKEVKMVGGGEYNGMGRWDVGRIVTCLLKVLRKDRRSIAEDTNEPGADIVEKDG